MKVFLNLLAAVAGGQITRAREFLNRFEAAAPNAQLIVLKEKTVLCEYATKERRRVLDVSIAPGKLRAFRRMGWENVVLARLMRRHAVDVYLTFSHYLPQLNQISTPSVVGISNLAPFSIEAWDHESFSVRIRLALLRRSIISSARRATRVLALSDACRNVLLENGIGAEKIGLTPNGVSTFWKDPVPATGLLERAGVVLPFLLYVSHFHRYKNHSRLVEAYARLPSRVRDSYQLVLIGRPYSESCYQETKMKIEQLGLGGKAVVIPGQNSEQLREFYQNAKLFVFPSLIENSPITLLEAMMAGAPIITSSLAPMPEFCSDAAEYFDALSVPDMSQRIQTLLLDANRLSTLKQRSPMQSHRFSWDEFVGRVLQNIDIALSQRAPSE